MKAILPSFCPVSDNNETFTCVQQRSQAGNVLFRPTPRNGAFKPVLPSKQPLNIQANADAMARSLQQASES